MPTYFPTWSALQHHIRTIHPPTCTHPSCQGRTFTSQRGLRAHHKLHEERELEEQMGDGVVIEDDIYGEETPRGRRRGGELGRDWKCDVDGCAKDFKSVSGFHSFQLVWFIIRVAEKGARKSCKCQPSWTS